MRLRTLTGALTLREHFVQDEAARDGDVERIQLSDHGDAHERITRGAKLPGNPGALRSDDEHGRVAVVDRTSPARPSSFDVERCRLELGGAAQGVARCTHHDATGSRCVECEELPHVEVVDGGNELARGLDALR
jgi:hypothetical protein